MRLAWVKNRRLLRWILRVAIPAVILLIHWALGMSLGRSLFRLFIYPLGFVVLLAVPGVNILVIYVLEPVLRLYGMRDSLPDGSDVRPWLRWVLKLLAYSAIVGFVIAGICINAGFLLLALIVAFYLVFFKLMDEEPSTSAEDIMRSKPQADLSQLLGREGISATPMRPAGRVRLDDNLHDAVAEGEYIDKEVAITVVAVRGRELKVRSSKGDL